jgi:hypothetical protein
MNSLMMGVPFATSWDKTEAVRAMKQHGLCMAIYLVFLTLVQQGNPQT